MSTSRMLWYNKSCNTYTDTVKRLFIKTRRNYGSTNSGEQPGAGHCSENISPIKKKKKKKGLIIFLVVLLIAAAAGAGCYFMERQKPVSTVKSFLEHVRTMNFEGMKSLLQSNDMSALDNADITNEAYHAFFQGVNQKMTCGGPKKQISALPMELPLSQQKSNTLTVLIFTRKPLPNF